MDRTNRIACVGGAGAMGAMGVQLLSDAGFDVLVLDRDEERGRALAEKTPGVTYEPFDVLTDDLADRLHDVDLVLNTLGPFDTHGLSVMRQTIEAGHDYLDINDDWEPTLEALTLDDRARDRGVTALIGMGASPGVSNVLATRAAAALDTVDTLCTGWALTGTMTEPGGPRPNAAMVHLVQQATGSIQVLHDGEATDVAPLQRIDLPYPGLGTIPVCTIGHPEPVTLPRVVKGLRRCINVMSGPGWFFDELQQRMALVDRGELTAVEAALDLEDRPILRPADAPRSIHTPGIWTVAYGTRDGEPLAVSIGLNRRPPGNMAGATAAPAVAAARLMLDGTIHRPGVVTAEEVLTTDQLLPLLEPLYDQPDPSLPMITVTEAPLHHPDRP